MKPFLCVAWIKPTKRGEEDGHQPKIVLPLTVILAKDESQAAMLAGRAISEEHADNLSRVEVAVRPF